ncbi:nucleotide disphospho-sugar-binding domain-containing protein [Tolypothrix bouteillei VB521301_2]|uniref:Glycosyl transferase n=1 Tax=Tolypothrix bouteillei VB521301 TaxID=1479485 RepID=A0A0C1R8E3_9CYAN|nr:nucleotide disphospho-sugar-binding domain-containing protein [Tolypothrix bouteillei]KAF3884071.1 hypothetical protein DA73_0400000060 [Tolypothrix bouteillei VB521301]
MKVLFGWELGGGQGHIHRLAALARILEPLGIEPVFALKSYKIKGIGFPWEIVFAPSLPFSGRSESYTFADILETFGFGNPHLLRSHLLAWQSVISQIKPSLAIADYAPGLVLAARGVIPTVVVGDSFAVPPRVEVFPPLRLPVPHQTQNRAEQVSNTIREVVKSDAFLGEIFCGDANFIFGIPELDPYGYLRTERDRYLSIHVTPIPRNLHKPEGPAWAYLYDDYPYRNLVLQTLKPECEFKSLTEVLSGKSMAIHHGSSTTAIACLLAGIPQLVFPQSLEHRLNAIALSGLGVAKMVSTPTWENLLVAQAETYALTPNALLLAQRLAHWNQNFVSVFVKTCLDFLAGASAIDA